jgi:hypothetical protein
MWYSICLIMAIFVRFWLPLGYLLLVCLICIQTACKSQKPQIPPKMHLSAQKCFINTCLYTSIYISILLIVFGTLIGWYDAVITKNRPKCPEIAFLTRKCPKSTFLVIFFWNLLIWNCTVRIHMSWDWKKTKYWFQGLFFAAEVALKLALFLHRPVVVVSKTGNFAKIAKVWQLTEEMWQTAHPKWRHWICWWRTDQLDFVKISSFSSESFVISWPDKVLTNHFSWPDKVLTNQSDEKWRAA